MRYALTPEQEQFGQTIRDFLETRAPESGLLARIEADDRLDRHLWQDISEQLELPGLTAPETFGGSGYGAVESAVVLEELGRSLTPIPYFASAVLTLPLLIAADGTGVTHDVITRLASGSAMGAAAVAEPGRRADAVPATSAVAGRLNGTKTLVMDGDVADVFVVSALTDGQPSFYLVDADADGVAVERQPMLDPTRGSAEIQLTDAPGTELGPPAGAEPMAILGDVLDRAQIALAAEQLGGAVRCLEIAVDHATTREQFGRPIGNFQSLKHQCAKTLYDIEVARSAMWYAAWAADAQADPHTDTPAADLAELVPTVKYLCSTTYQEAARRCVHILGGIGFTWEHPAHLFFKRATSSAQFLGTPTEALHRLADQMLPPGLQYQES